MEEKPEITADQVSEQIPNAGEILKLLQTDIYGPQSRWAREDQNVDKIKFFYTIAVGSQCPAIVNSSTQNSAMIWGEQWMVNMATGCTFLTWDVNLDNIMHNLRVNKGTLEAKKKRKKGITRKSMPEVRETYENLFQEFKKIGLDKELLQCVKKWEAFLGYWEDPRSNKGAPKTQPQPQAKKYKPVMQPIEGSETFAYFLDDSDDDEEGGMPPNSIYTDASGDSSSLGESGVSGRGRKRKLPVFEKYDDNDDECFPTDTRQYAV